MKRAKFKTKLSRAQKRKNVRFFFEVFGCCYAFTVFFGTVVVDAFEGSSVPEILLISLGMTVFIAVMLLAPIMLAAIALGLQSGKAKRVSDSVTYVPTQNIEYYRDLLDGLNPSTVSLLVDLDIYGQKDIAATLLRMKNKNVIDFQNNGQITVTGRKTPKLDHAERELLAEIKSGGLVGKKALSQWKRNRFADAEKAGYIRKKKAPSDNKKMKFVGIALGSMLPMFGLWGVFLGCDILNKNMFVGMAYLLVLGAVIFFPWYFAMREVSYWSRGDVIWERTELGNETAEKIAGLSRFIREFSLLSEANRESVELWDDYLVYAIVLEENEKIAADICKRCKINLRRFKWELY